MFIHRLKLILVVTGSVRCDSRSWRYLNLAEEGKPITPHSGQHCHPRQEEEKHKQRKHGEYCAILLQAGAAQKVDGGCSLFLVNVMVP